MATFLRDEQVSNVKIDEDALTQINAVFAARLAMLPAINYCSQVYKSNLRSVSTLPAAYGFTSGHPMSNTVLILLADLDPRRFCVVIPPPVGKRRFIDRNIFPFRSTEFVPINNAKGRNRIEGNLVEPPK